MQAAAAIILWYLEAPFEAYLTMIALLNAYPGISLLLQMLLSLKGTHQVMTNPLRSRSGTRFFRVFLRIASGNSLLSTLATSRHQIALFIVATLSGGSASGLFAVASRCSNAITRFAAPLNQIMFPEVMRLLGSARTAEIKGTIRRITVSVALGALTLMVVGVLGSQIIVTAAAGQDFVTAAPMFALLLVAELTLVAGVHFTPIILAEVGQRPLLILNSAIAAAMYLAAMGLGSYVGPAGVAVGLLAGAACTYAASSLMATRVVNIVSSQPRSVGL
jgi:O-antigen/teichoic acid export membrane protein